MKDNIVNEGLKYGIVCGLTALLLMFGGWAMGIDRFVSIQYISTFIPYMIIIIIIGGIQLRKANDGYLTFAQALKFSFLSYVIAAVLIAISTYLLYNVIDKDLTEKSLQIGLEKTRAMMEKFGASEESIEKALADAEEQAGDTGLKKILLGTGLGLIWDFVKSLLIAIVIKKEKKITFDN